MRVLVFSDSHGDSRLMAQIIGADTLASNVIFLGDYVSDILRVRALHPHLEYHIVAGNCDSFSPFSDDALIELGGVKLYLTHGHVHAVKSGPDRLFHHTGKLGACAALFGHTHVAALTEKNGITLLNPGSITEPRGAIGVSYAVMNIIDGIIDAQIIEVKSSY
ncbi:MAG: YfcE family phosphodiesterase [Defluviitaleaceae bacterium]|nr:YfcE family phosphodiesterase [Defluviitaleaceae bacterium]